MTQLAADRNTPERDARDFEFPVLAATKIYAGSLVVLDADGWAKPGAAALALLAAGRAECYADNSAGANGDIRVRVRRGCFRFANSAAGDAIAKAEIGDACYVADDQTVAKTDGGGARSKAGIVADVDSLGVWVDIGFETFNSPAASLLAANNLSDVGTKATARNNLGVFEKMAAPAFVIGAEAANVINVAVQLKDSAGANLAVRGSLFAYLSDDANGDSVAAAAPSGGVAIGADGLAIPLVAGKAFQLTSEANGHIDLNITEAAAKSFYLILAMPDGRLAASAAITFA